MASENRFGIADYCVFAATLLLSCLVGVYFAWQAARKARSSSGEGNQTAEFLIGGRKLPVGPVSLSLMTTFVSGFSLLGVPAEVYQRGLLMWLYQMMGVPSLLICATMFLPIFYRIRPISIYEYFELRFGGTSLRKLAAFLFLLNSMFYMAVVMYAPAVALSGVTGVPTWPFILSVGVVCTFYTSLGGLKGVVWTDTLQAGFMYGGVLALIIKGTIDAGGLERVWSLAIEGGRVAPLGFIDPNPFQYFSLWIGIFGGISFWMSLYGLNQMAVQRYCSLATLRQAYMVIGITVPTYLILLSLCGYIGILMVAYFWNCDPLASKEIETNDQLVIYFVTQTLGSIPGLPGLFLASLFSGTLSTVSSGINSMAAVTWEDFLKNMKCMEHISDARSTLVSKLLVVTYGACALALAFAAGPMGGIIKAAVSMMGSLAGPLVGLFFLGVIFRNATKFGAIVSTVIAMLFCMWITLGSIIYKPYQGYMLHMNNTCTNASNTSLGYDIHYGNPDIFILYRTSTYLYALIGILMVVGLGLLISVVWSRLFGAKFESDDKDRSEYTLFPRQKSTIDSELRVSPLEPSSTAATQLTILDSSPEKKNETWTHF